MHTIYLSPNDCFNYNILQCYSYWFVISGIGFYSLVYTLAFSPRQDIPGYMILGLCSLVICNLVAVVFLRIIPPDEGDSYEQIDEQSKDKQKEGEEDLKLVEESSKPLMVNFCGELTLLQAIRTVDFHLLFWSCIIANSVSFVYTFNLLVYLKSFRLENLKSPLLAAGTTVAACSKLIFGFAADKTLTKCPRIVYYIVMVSLITLVMFFSCFVGDRAFMVVLSTILTFLSTAVSMSFVPVIVCDTFGTRYHSSIFGTIYFGTGFGNLVLSSLMGAVYDLNAEDGSDTCYGLQCFRVIFIISTVLCVSALIMLEFLYKRTKHPESSNGN